MPLQSSGQLTARDIANEFGYSRGSTDGIRIGDYRGQGFTNSNNTTVRIPTSENVTNDPNGSVRFSDFYGGRLTLVVNYFSSAENKPVDAYTRFDGQVQKTVVSGFKLFSSDNTAGKRVVILVNEDFGSDKTANASCALRTGTGWNADTVMEVLVGPDGEILGAGGDGGNQRPGSSGLGVQFEGVGGTSVVIQNGGRIAGGGGGGGTGGDALVEERQWFDGARASSEGGAGGGGAGLPAGSANGTKELGGAGGVASRASTGRGAFCIGGTGGNGGNLGAAGGNGTDGTLGGDYERGESEADSGLGGGVAGAAIRRTVTTVNVTNLGPPSQLVGSTVETGVT